ncbi:MAG: hypothetical protein HOQ24_06845 [Mycobacteriaceae bacterium]|nr:hypothetical protein [Mycobacteriaceae bacterium]
MLRDGYADRALQWPDSWVPRLNYEPADPRVTRIEMAARLSEMQEGTTEFAILRDQMAHVDGLSHEYWQRALQVHVLRSAIADPHRDPVGYAHALQRIEQAARDVDQVSRQAGFAGPRPLEDVDPGAVRQVTDEFGVHVVGGFDDPHREAFAIQVVNDLYGRRVLDSEALGPEHRHHFLSRRAALAHFRGDGESATVVLREIDPKHTNLAVPPELGGAAATAPQEAIAGRVVPGPLDTVSVWRRVDNGVFVEIDPSTYGLTTLNGPASGWAEVTAGVHAVALDGEGALITRNDGPIRDPHQIDELRYDQLHAKVPKSSGGHDAALDALAVTMGYDQPPTVARRDRIDAVLAHGGLELYLTREQAMALQRGTVDSYAPVQALRTTTPRTASDPKLVRVALRPDAVIVDEYRLQRLRQSEVNRAETAGGNLSDDLDHLVERIGLANRRTVLDHLDRLAVAHQYQAYVKPMVDYAGADFVVLDHTALVLPEIEPVPEIAAPVVTENAIAAARPDPPTDESLPIADMLDEFGPVGSLRATFAFEQLVGSGNGSRWKLTEVNPVTAVDRDRMLGRFEWLDAERQVWDREAVGYSAKFTFYNESARSADPNPVGAMTVYAYRDDLGSRVVFVEPARTGNSAFEPAFVLRIHAMLAHPESGAHRLEVRARGNDPALTDILDWDQTPGRWAKTSESIRTSIAAEWLRSMPDDHQRTLMDLERWLDDGSFAQRLTPRALAELGAGPRERRLGTILTQFLNWNGVCQYRVSPR